MSTEKNPPEMLASGSASSQLELCLDVIENKPVSEVVSLDIFRAARLSSSLIGEDESKFISKKLIKRVSLF